jgi:16S rRNA (cytosine967-C5)-methyltransferase
VLAETAGVVEAVLAARSDVRLEDAHSALAATPGVRLDPETCRGPLEGTVQLWPHRHNTDAMFLALLRRL